MTSSTPPQAVVAYRLVPLVAILSVAGHTLAGVQIRVVGNMGLTFLSLALARAILAWRLPHCVRARDALDAAGAVLVAGIGLVLVSYLGQGLAWPTWDREIAALELALGIDWPTVIRSADRWPIVLAVLSLAYATYYLQLFTAATVLAATGRHRALDLFLIAFVATALLSIAIGSLAPTYGPEPLQVPPLDLRYVRLTGATPAAVLDALRSGSLRVVDLDRLDGLVTFPSMHAAVAVLVPWALRPVPRLFWPAVALNLLMAASAVTTGGHYVIDVVGGALVAIAGIALAEPLRRRLLRILGPRSAAAPGQGAAKADEVRPASPAIRT
ncbi:phosphatase PAP2 family protein [Prosthecomicrobium sp. N25]|uniref:phosphatase PAP2 family protein n=1 Tax=Prosthecomicrobium sp. N25 TaxID=3129254 RepID=UPI0030769F97